VRSKIMPDDDEEEISLPPSIVYDRVAEIKEKRKTGYTKLELINGDKENDDFQYDLFKKLYPETTRKKKLSVE
jgi:hypothetical protein